MDYWTSNKFWVLFAGYFLLCLFLFGGFGAAFIPSTGGDLKAFCIVCSSLLVSSALAWRMARDALLHSRKRDSEKRAA